MRDQDERLSTDLREYYAQIAAQPSPAHLKEKIMASTDKSQRNRRLRSGIGGSLFFVATATAVAAFTLGSHHSTVAVGPAGHGSPTAPAATHAPLPTSPAPAVTPPATPSPVPVVTDAQARTTAAALFQRQVTPLGETVYVDCGTTPASTGGIAGCPFTDRLANRIRALSNVPTSPGLPGPVDPISRAQNQPSNVVATTVTRSGNRLVVHLDLYYFTVTPTTAFDVTVVAAGGTALIDDTACAGRPQTSEYAATLAICP